MATVAEIQSQIDDLNNKISKLSGGLGSAGVRTTYETQIRNLQPQLTAARQAEERQQQEQQAQQQQQQQQQEQQQQQQQPQQQATPIAQVAPQAAGNQLPTLKQSIIDDQLNKFKTNELTSFNSDIRDQIYNAGWNQKSDAVQVLKGAAVYGLAKPINAGIMGNPEYQKPDGSTVSDQDFINAAKAAGIDPNQYVSSIRNMGQTTTTINRDALYNAINDKSKDLYSITNAVEGAERGDKALHATVLYKADGNGNLVVQNNPTTGQPDVKYFDAVRYANPESFMDTWGPFLALAPALGGIIGSALQGANLAPETLAAANQASTGGGFINGGYGSIGNVAGDVTAGLGYGQIANAADIASDLPFNPNAPSYSDIIPADQFGAQGEAFGTNINAIGTPGATVPAIGPLTLKEQVMQALGGNTQSALGNLLNPSGSNTGAVNTALANSALTSLLGSGGQAISSYLSGQAQANAAKQAAANQMAMFNTINNQLAPQRGAGYSALNQIRGMLPGQYTTYGETGQPTGTAQGTDYFTRQFSPQDLQAGLAPNYQFMLGQGQQQAQRQANLAGGGVGGNALRALQDYTQNYAGNAYQNAFQNFQNQRTGIYNTLAGIAGLGQQATGIGATTGQNAVTAQGQLGVGGAAAQAAGNVGAANAVQGGLQNYQNNQLLQAILAQNQNVAQKPA